MFSLVEGIHFEDSKEILRWKSTRADAWKIGKPSSRFQNDDTRIQWKETMLGGQPCGLLAYLPDDSVLEKVSLWLTPKENTYRFNDALFHYCRLFDHLVKQLGSPTVKQSTNNSFYAPVLTWRHDGCLITLMTGERHGDFTSLEISKL